MKKPIVYFLMILSVIVSLDLNAQNYIKEDVYLTAGVKPTTFYEKSKNLLPYKENLKIKKDKLILNSTFRFLLKPLLTRSIVSDKGIIKMGTGFSLDIDNKEATISANFSKLLFQKTYPIILSAGFNSSIDPDNNYSSLVKGNNAEFGFGGNIRLTGLYPFLNKIAYAKNDIVVDAIKYKRLVAINNDIEGEEKQISDYIDLYKLLKADEVVLKAKLDIYLSKPYPAPPAVATEDLYNLLTVTDAVMGINLQPLNVKVKAFYAKYLTAPIPANPALTIKEWIKIESDISDTLQKMLVFTKEFIKKSKDVKSEKKYVKNKTIDYEVKNINEMVTGFTIYYWDINFSYARTKYGTLDRTQYATAFDSKNKINGEQESNIGGMDFSPINIVRYRNKSLLYFNVNINWKYNNTYSVLNDKDKITFQATKQMYNQDSILVTKVKEFKGYDKYAHPFDFFNTVDLKLYLMAYFGEKKTVGLEGTFTAGFRPQIEKTITPDQKKSKLDFSTGLLLSVPSKSKDDKDEKILNIAFLLNFNDLLNSNKEFDYTDDTSNKERLKNTFGFGVRVGIPINKILL